MNPAPPVTRTVTSDGSREMAASEFFSDNVAWRPARRRTVAVERIEQRPIARGYSCNVIVAGVEQHSISPHSAAPWSRNEFRRFDWTGMQQAVAARAVCRNRERVTRWIDYLHVWVIAHTQIATRGWLAIERGRKHAMLDRHPFRSSKDYGVKAGATPGFGNSEHFLSRQLDREYDPRSAERKNLHRCVLIEAVDRIIRNNVAACL